VNTQILTPGVQFGYHAVGGPDAANWNATNTTPTSIDWEHNSGLIPQGLSNDVIQFCLDNITTTTPAPQQILLTWYGIVNGQEVILCEEIIEVECEAENDCLVITDQHIECDTINEKYIYTFTATNVSSIPFSATNLILDVCEPTGISITPSGGFFTLSPPLATGQSQTITTCIEDAGGTFPISASELVFKYRLAYFNNGSADTCCFENILDTIPLPYCGGPCPPDDVVIGDVPIGQQVYKTAGRLTSDAIIAPNSDIQFLAGNQVRLVPGFHAQAGSQFIARIEDCCDGDVVINGDFAMGNTGFMTDLPERCFCSAGSFCVDDNARDKCTVASWGSITSPSNDNYLIVDATGTPFQVWGQTVNVYAGETYAFLFDLYANISGTGSPSLELRVDGTPIATGLTGTINTWTTLGTNWTATLTGAVTIEIIQVGGTGTGDYGIDSIRFDCDDPSSSSTGLQQRIVETRSEVGQPNIKNYPNPFTNSTTIEVELATAQQGTLTVFDISGKVVREWQQTFDAGKTMLEFRAEQLEAGVYFYRLQTEATVISKSMVLMRN
jgi:hypothetical protein